MLFVVVKDNKQLNSANNFKSTQGRTGGSGRPGGGNRQLTQPWEACDDPTRHVSPVVRLNLLKGSAALV